MPKKPHVKPVDLTKEKTRKTIGEMKRQGGTGDRREFIEKVCTDMDENNYNPHEMVRKLTENAGFQVISVSQLRLIHKLWKIDPRLAVKDMRHFNKRRKTEMTEDQKRALDLIIGHHRHYDSGFPDALETFKREYLTDNNLKEEDLPKLWRCYDEWERLTDLQKYARGEDYKAFLEKHKFWTHGRKLKPDEEHNFDEGKLTFAKFIRLKNKKRIRVMFNLQVDVSTWVMRGYHYSWSEFTEREQMVAAKKAQLPNPEIGFDYCCMPRITKCDNGSTHWTLSMTAFDEWMRNRPGRQGKLHHNPKAAPLATPASSARSGKPNGNSGGRCGAISTITSGSRMSARCWNLKRSVRWTSLLLLSSSKASNPSSRISSAGTISARRATPIVLGSRSTTKRRRSGPRT